MFQTVTYDVKQTLNTDESNIKRFTFCCHDELAKLCRSRFTAKCAVCVFAIRVFLLPHRYSRGTL